MKRGRSIAFVWPRKKDSYKKIFVFGLIALLAIDSLPGGLAAFPVGPPGLFEMNMDYQLKNEILSILSDLRGDIDKTAELLRDDHSIESVNLLGDIARDSEALRGVLRLGLRHTEQGKKAADQPVGDCPL